MTICELFPHTLDYFLLDEKPAEDVIFFICRMMERGASGNSAVTETKKKVYADQVNWY